MGRRGALRTIVAASRQAERESSRRRRELLKAEASRLKLQAGQLAAQEVRAAAWFTIKIPSSWLPMNDSGQQSLVNGT